MSEFEEKLHIYVVYVQRVAPFHYLSISTIDSKLERTRARTDRRLRAHTRTREAATSQFSLRRNRIASNSREGGRPHHAEVHPLFRSTQRNTGAS